MNKKASDNLLNELISIEKILIVQDLDGVCIPLVKDPLTREIDSSYVLAAHNLKNEFSVLTNGEHEGRRGVNRLVEKCLGPNLSRENGYYLPGLAAGGIEYQDRFGNALCDSLSTEEIEFLKNIPIKMKLLMRKHTKHILPNIKEEQLDLIINKSVLDTNYSPTINLNSLFELVPGDINKQRELQMMLKTLMESLLALANENNLHDSFYLHIAPNLGIKNGQDIIKYSTEEDIGTTDIQFMVKGAYKENGLLVLINKYIFQSKGYYPLGIDFNAKSCPLNSLDQLEICKRNIKKNDMPTIIGVGDTVTSFKSEDNKKQLRGGSDRGFLYLIQEIGKIYELANKVILVDSSHGEVQRPTLANKSLHGISDADDPLKFNLLVKGGPTEYIEFFKELSLRRNN